MPTPIAVQRVVRGSDGRIRAIYIDINTLQEVTDLTGYRVVTANTKSEPEPVESVDQPNEDTPVTDNPVPQPNDQGDRTPNYSRTGDSPFTRSAVRQGNTPARQQGAPVGPITRAPSNPVTNRTEADDNFEETAPSENRGIANAEVASGDEGSARYGNIRGDLEEVNRDTVESVQRMASLDPDGVSLSSGYRDPEKNAAVGGKKDSQHLHGNAVDRSLKGMTDEEKTRAVADARYAGFERIGAYSGKKGLHLDNATRWEGDPRSQPDGTYAMFDASADNMGNAPGWFTEGLSDRALRHPNPEPNPGPDSSFVSQDERVGSTGNVANAVVSNSVNPERFGGTSGGIAMTPDSAEYNRSYFGPDRTSNYTQSYETGPSSGLGTSEDQAIESVLSRESITPNEGQEISGFVGQNELNAGNIFSQIGPQASAVNTLTGTPQTPAQLAAMGGVTRTPAELEAISVMVAGELSPNSLKALKAGDPKAKQELANMLTSVENRAMSKMYGSLGKVLDPSQYNSLMPDNLKTTYDNYELYKDVLNQNIPSFYTGGLIPSSWDISNYFNPSISAPKWGLSLMNPDQVNEHIFGSLPEYGPSEQFTKAYSDFASKTGWSNPNRDVESYDNMSYSGQNRGYDTPSETSGRGSGFASESGRYDGSSYSGQNRGLDSPSEGSRGERGGGMAGGYSGRGGMDSPSEGGGRFGGGGLGNAGSSTNSAGSGKSTSGTPGSSPGGGWGNQTSAHDNEHERDRSL